MSDPPKEAKPIQIQIQLPAELSGGRYTNMARIFHSHTEFVIDAVYLQPDGKTANVVSRIILSPVNARFLHAALGQNIRSYEKKYGTIAVPKASGDSGPILH